VIVKRITINDLKIWKKFTTDQIRFFRIASIAHAVC